MSSKLYDIIIIGSGMAGLYSAYNIKRTAPDTSFLILEKYKKQWIGGRTSNEMFYGTEIVTGAGIGRFKKGKGYKSITNYHKGRKASTSKKPIHKSHVGLIQMGKFIPGLFADCTCKKGKTRKRR